MRTTVKWYPIFVQDAEDGGTAGETTYGEDVIEGVAFVVHIDDVLLTLQLRESLFGLWYLTDILL